MAIVVLGGGRVVEKTNLKWTGEVENFEKLT